MYSQIEVSAEMNKNCFMKAGVHETEMLAPIEKVR